MWWTANLSLIIGGSASSYVLSWSSNFCFWTQLDCKFHVYKSWWWVMKNWFLTLIWFVSSNVILNHCILNYFPLWQLNSLATLCVTYADIRAKFKLNKESYCVLIKSFACSVFLLLQNRALLLFSFVVIGFKSQVQGSFSCYFMLVLGFYTMICHRPNCVVMNICKFGINSAFLNY